jgi:23S rRNA G2445 N2-methylase RlmL
MSPPKPHALECFAIAAPGLEPLVATEVRGLAALPVGEGGGAFLLDRIRAVRGGVEFRADHAGLAAVQLRARIASRVLVRLATFRAAGDVPEVAALSLGRGGGARRGGGDARGRRGVDGR